VQKIDLVEVLINWFPMLLLVAVWVIFLWWARRKGGYSTQYQRDYMDQMRKQTELLERVASALEKKG
jgi:nitrogen fixation-related uncharacterized protein